MPVWGGPAIFVPAFFIFLFLFFAVDVEVLHVWT